MDIKKILGDIALSGFETYVENNPEFKKTLIKWGVNKYWYILLLAGIGLVVSVKFIIKNLNKK